jgi:predicted DNA-binding protein with PD1-like motif
MKAIAVRLKEGELFRESIESIAIENNIQAGVILSVVGGLQNAVLRMPKVGENPHQIKQLEGPFELLSATGTVNYGDSHIHIAISDLEARSYGGHLKPGCKVKNTVELVIGVLEDVEFSREIDPATGFEELLIKHKQ